MLKILGEKLKICATLPVRRVSAFEAVVNSVMKRRVP